MTKTKWGKYTPAERWQIFCGRDAGPAVWACRAAWLLFACWTMGMAGTEVSIAPGYWIAGVLIYYFYPCD